MSTREKPKRETKGERTAKRILDAAEDLFGQHGYDGTSLRQIAERATIKEPGIYNHYAGKQALYEAVLFRGLNPMAEALEIQISTATRLRDYTELPSIMTDLLLAHPQMAALFQQAMQGDPKSLGNQLMGEWLNRLFGQGMRSLENPVAREGLSSANQDREVLVINLIAIFNLTTGYFLSQRAFDALAQGDIKDPENIARQKKLLHKVIRAMLIS